MEYFKGLILFLIIANITLSSYIIYTDLTGKEGLCLTGQDCKIVQNSSYSSIFGIKLSYFGLISFIILLIIFILYIKNKVNLLLFKLVTFLGVLFAFYFLYLQIFVIKAICSTCLTIASIAIIIFFLSFKLK